MKAIEILFTIERKCIAYEPFTKRAEVESKCIGLIDIKLSKLC